MTTAHNLDTAHAHKHFAKALNQEAWKLLGLDARSPAESEQLLLAAYGSLYHWGHAGTVVHRARGHWLISRVHCVLGQGAAGLQWAQTCAMLTAEHAGEMSDFDHAYAEEALARANAAAGHLTEAQRHRRIAHDLGTQIAGPEDRKIFLGDLEAGPWFGLSS